MQRQFKLIDQQLQLNNLIRVPDPIPKTANSFFRALSISIFANHNQTDYVKSIMKQTLRANCEAYLNNTVMKRKKKHHIAFPIISESSELVKKYLNDKQMLETYFQSPDLDCFQNDNYELASFTFNRRVSVFYLNKDNYLNETLISCCRNKRGKKIMLAKIGKRYFAVEKETTRSMALFIKQSMLGNLINRIISQRGDKENTMVHFSGYDEMIIGSHNKKFPKIHKKSLSQCGEIMSKQQEFNYDGYRQENEEGFVMKMGVKNSYQNDLIVNRSQRQIVNVNDCVSSELIQDDQGQQQKKINDEGKNQNNEGKDNINSSTDFDINKLDDQSRQSTEIQGNKNIQLIVPIPQNEAVLEQSQNTQNKKEKHYVGRNNDQNCEVQQQDSSLRQTQQKESINQSVLTEQLTEITVEGGLFVGTTQIDSNENSDKQPYPYTGQYAQGSSPQYVPIYINQQTQQYYAQQLQQQYIYPPYTYYQTSEYSSYYNMQQMLYDPQQYYYYYQSQHQQQQQPDSYTYTQPQQLTQNNRYRGRLKFYDSNGKYGFIIVDGIGSDIFVHYDDLSKAGMTKQQLQAHSTSRQLRFEFTYYEYEGKSKKAKKAIDLQLLTQI